MNLLGTVLKDRTKEQLVNHWKDIQRNYKLIDENDGDPDGRIYDGFLYELEVLFSSKDKENLKLIIESLKEFFVESDFLIFWIVEKYYRLSSLGNKDLIDDLLRSIKSSITHSRQDPNTHKYIRWRSLIDQYLSW